MMLLTLRGTPFLYYGDEIGLPEVETSRGASARHGRACDDDAEDRDRCRTPMPWTARGRLHGGAEPWLPFGDRCRNVADQRKDPRSTLHLMRDLIALRRQREDLRTGAYTTLAAPDGAWPYRRGERHAVALNLSDEPVTVEGVAGLVLVGTDRRRDGEHVSGTLALAPWEAVVLELEGGGELS